MGGLYRGSGRVWGFYGGCIVVWGFYRGQEGSGGFMGLL